MLFKSKEILYMALNLSQIYIPQMGSGKKLQNQIILNNWDTVHTSNPLNFAGTGLNSFFSLSRTYFFQKQILFSHSPNPLFHRRK